MIQHPHCSCLSSFNIAGIVGYAYDNKAMSNQMVVVYPTTIDVIPDNENRHCPKCNREVKAFVRTKQVRLRNRPLYRYLPLTI